MSEEAWIILVVAIVVAVLGIERGRRIGSIRRKPHEPTGWSGAPEDVEARREIVRRLFRIRNDD